MRAQQIIRSYLPNIVYGANDGLLTTFAIVSGVVGAKFSHDVVLVLGFASLVADGISMGASNYLSMRTPGSEEDGELSTKTKAVQHGIATFVGFIVLGSLPLLAFLLPIPSDQLFIASGVLTFSAMFFVGAGRALFADMNWLRAGLEMLLIGVAAAGVAYLIGQSGALLVEQLGS
jgi:VIT1/CCC1 family predicted Fe2+/Mn2+ transporter